jgi:hypothetical protein
MGGNMWSPIRTWRFGFGQMRRVSLKWGSPKASKISLLQGKPMVLGHPKFENHAYSEKTYIQWTPHIPIAVCALYSAPFHCSSSTFTNFPSWFPQQSDSCSMIFYNFHSFPIHFPFRMPLFLFWSIEVHRGSLADHDPGRSMALCEWLISKTEDVMWISWEHLGTYMYTIIYKNNHTHTHARTYVYIYICIYVLKTSENLGYSHSVPWKYSRILIVDPWWFTPVGKWIIYPYLPYL